MSAKRHSMVELMKNNVLQWKVVGRCVDRGEDAQRAVSEWVWIQRNAQCNGLYKPQKLSGPTNF